MKSSQSPTDFEPNNYEVTSIPGCAIKKNGSRGAKHGPSERQKKHGNHPTLLSRWYASESDRTSLSDIGCEEKHIMLL